MKTKLYIITLFFVLSLTALVFVIVTAFLPAKEAQTKALVSATHVRQPFFDQGLEPDFDMISRKEIVTSVRQGHDVQSIPQTTQHTSAIREKSARAVALPVEGTVGRTTYMRHNEAITANRTLSAPLLALRQTTSESVASDPFVAQATTDDQASPIAYVDGSGGIEPPVSLGSGFLLLLFALSYGFCLKEG